MASHRSCLLEFDTMALIMHKPACVMVRKTIFLTPGFGIFADALTDFCANLKVPSCLSADVLQAKAHQLGSPASIY
ncbi:hypothetical protein M758_10G158600 [Ceratodon purpureus]|nr:hypothetical protein M758_10G158600 [Ceratodon purpureus]